MRVPLSVSACSREPAGDGVAGRFFLKQDHQGPPGHAHGGILASALDEAMAMVILESYGGPPGPRPTPGRPLRIPQYR